MTAGERTRVLPWKNCLNVRDVGGYPVAGADSLAPKASMTASPARAFTRWKALVRGDDPGKLTSDSLLRVFDYGIRTVIDLRHAAEVNAGPNPLRAGHGMSYHNISFVDPVDTRPPREGLGLHYTLLAEQAVGRIRRVLETIARAPDGGVLIHCVAGKDRTGVITAVVLRLAGVPPDVIAEDYMLTERLTMDRVRAWLDSDPARRAEREAQYQRFRPTGDAMRYFLDAIDRRHGSMAAFVGNAGLAETTLRVLRERFLVGA